MSQLGILGMFHFRCVPGQEEQSFLIKIHRASRLHKKLIYFHVMYNWTNQKRSGNYFNLRFLMKRGKENSRLSSPLLFSLVFGPRGVCRNPNVHGQRQGTQLYESTPHHGTLCDLANLAHGHPGPVWPHLGLELRPLLLSPGPYKLRYKIFQSSILSW